MDISVNISSITGSFIDYPSREDMCISIYMSGCDGLCVNCQNKELQNSCVGDKYDFQKLINILPQFEKKYMTKKICLLGGDPLYTKNIDFTRHLLYNIGNKYDFCVYTGYDIDYIIHNRISGFKYVKCGRYVESLSQQSLKTDSYMQLASSNQIIYNDRYQQLTQNGIIRFKE